MSSPFVITEDKLLESTEKIIYRTQSINKENPYTEFCLTDEYLYIYETVNNNENNLHIIKKSKITAVSVNTQKYAKNISSYLLVSILIILAGILIPILTNNNFLFFILAIGVIILIVGIIIGKPKYNLTISIHTPTQLNIIVNGMLPEALKRLQYEILKEKN